jgi:hypothetical protein
MEEGRQEEQQHEERRIAEYMEEGTTIDSVPLRVVECCGEAGDAFLVHPMMYHASAPNCATMPRFMRSTHIQLGGSAA